MCTAAAPGCGSRRGRSPSPRRSSRGSRSMRHGLRGQLCFLAGMLTYEPPGLVLVVRAGFAALVDVDLLPALLVDVARLLGIRERMARGILDVVDPLALGEQVVRLVVVRLPECAAVRCQRIATDLDLVADHPGGERPTRSPPTQCDGRPSSNRCGSRHRQRARSGMNTKAYVAEHGEPGEETRGGRPAHRNADRRPRACRGSMLPRRVGRAPPG